MTSSYRELLARAKKLDTEESWAPVIGMEEAAIAERCLPPDEAAAFLEAHKDGHPKAICMRCDARAMPFDVEAVYVSKVRGALCRTCAYVQAASEMGWPIRGCDASGHPNNPTHPWNRHSK